MKKGIIFILTACTVVLTYAQDDIEKTKFDGTWKIMVRHIEDDNEEESFYCLVKQGKVYPLDSDDENGVYINTQSYDVFNSDFTRNNLAFFWMNSGGAWTETQSYSLSLINEDKMKVRKFRHVNNADMGDNETWGYFQEGYAYRLE